MNDATTTRSPRRRVARLVAVTLVVAAISVLGVRAWKSWRRPSLALSPTGVRRVIPEGTRVKVELLNATDTRGLARTAVAVLRDAGFDVVFFGNTPERHDSTVVRERSNHPEWATLAAGLFPPARTEVRADSGRLVDLTILVGRSWRPPTEPLRP